MWIRTEDRVFVQQSFFYSSRYPDKTIFTFTLTNQISLLTIDINTNDDTQSDRTTPEPFFGHVLTMFPNLQILTLAQNEFGYQYIFFSTLTLTVMSSTLLELHICLVVFDQCLCLLDGHVNQPRTFYADVQNISSSPLTIANQVDYFAQSTIDRK